MGCCFFFFNDTATTEIYTLSLHDALPISPPPIRLPGMTVAAATRATREEKDRLLADFERYCAIDRKSTRLNSSHANISYAVFCLKKKTASQSSIQGQHASKRLHCDQRSRN